MNKIALGIGAIFFAIGPLSMAIFALPLGPSLSTVALVFAGWQVYCGLRPLWDLRSRIVLRLWGLEWTRDEACCHFFITGATGTGKTARAVVPIVHGLRATLPDTGILAIDSKGALWRPLAEMAKALGHDEDLRLIRVRPTHIPPAQWEPPLRLNLLADQTVPWAAYAKMIVDTATAAGQRGGQTFFKEAARDAIAHAMQALALTESIVTLDRVHDTICTTTGMASIQQELTKIVEGKGPNAKAAEVEQQFFKDFNAQPPEQKGGSVFTIANFLRPYTPPDIAQVFCCRTPNCNPDTALALRGVRDRAQGGCIHGKPTHADPLPRCRRERGENRLGENGRPGTPEIQRRHQWRTFVAKLANGR